MLPTIITGLILLGLGFLAVRKILRDRKDGVCTGCPSAGGCSHREHSHQSH